MNKIELGWTFGKVCVPVARNSISEMESWMALLLRRALERLEWGRKTYEPKLTAPYYPLCSLCSKSCSVVWVRSRALGRPSSAQTEVGVRLPSYLGMVSFFLGEYWAQLFPNTSFRTLIIPFPFRKNCLLCMKAPPPKKAGWFIVLGQNLFDTVFRWSRRLIDTQKRLQNLLH